MIFKLYHRGYYRKRIYRREAKRDSTVLYTSFLDLTWHNTTSHLQNACNVGSKIRNALGTSAYNNDTERQDFDVLLKLQISVKCDKYITDKMCSTEQVAIFNA